MYLLEIKKRALKEIEKIPTKDQSRIFAALEILCTNPFSGKKLEGAYEGAWSIRVWPYRIIYTITKEIITITVLRVGHRQGIYKK